jgi:hypothetical protein
MNGQSTATENQSASDNAPNNSNPGSGNTGSSSNGGGKTDTANNTSAPNGESSASGPCIDSDGDGWGWNGASCRVAGQSATSPSGGTGTPVPSVTDGTCIDGDGDGWGWNGTSSCRPTGAANNPTGGRTGSGNVNDGEGVCIDSDGDGWGWTGTRSCRVTEVPVGPADSPVRVSGLRPADITDLVLLTGQSNALGANTAYDTILDAPNDRVFAFTSQGWRVADLHQIWDRGWHPRNHPATDPSNNLLLHFGKRLVALDRSRVVGFILASEPGAAISHWDYGGDFYRELEARVLDAINQLPQKSALDGLLWHQGETDANDTPYYSQKLTALIAGFRSENWFSAGKPFICGEIAARGGVNNRLKRLNSDGDPYTGCVSAAGLSTRADGSHFDAEGLRELGVRYADRFYDMTR